MGRVFASHPTRSPDPDTQIFYRECVLDESAGRKLIFDVANKCRSGDQRFWGTQKMIVSKKDIISFHVYETHFPLFTLHKDAFVVRWKIEVTQRILCRLTNNRLLSVAICTRNKLSFTTQGEVENSGVSRIWRLRVGSAPKNFRIHSKRPIFIHILLNLAQSWNWVIRVGQNCLGSV